jgi:hypothetical protein
LHLPSELPKRGDPEVEEVRARFGFGVEVDEVARKAKVARSGNVASTERDYVDGNVAQFRV